jgi:hypothetical protein
VVLSPPHAGQERLALLAASCPRVVFRSRPPSKGPVPHEGAAALRIGGREEHGHDGQLTEKNGGLGRD